MANKKARPAGEPGVRTDARQVSLAELKAVQSGITEHWDIREDPQVHRQADHGERESGLRTQDFGPHHISFLGGHPDWAAQKLLPNIGVPSPCESRYFG